MKFTKSEIKNLVLQEFADRASSIDNPSAVLHDHETKIFNNYVNAITVNLTQLEKVLREDETLDRKDLVHFKEKILDDVYQKIAFVESAVDHRLKTKNENK
jgi:hypothetical protein